MSECPVVILGAGMSGLCMAIKLQEAGFDDLVILEKSADVGGTWNDNSYPGACCDVASHMYSYSFFPNPDWSRAYSPQPEIEAYFQRCAAHFGLLEKIRFNTEVTAARFDDAAGEWEVATAGGDTLRCRVLVSGLGQLNLPHVPAFVGADSFTGPAFHSARWDHSVDLAGQRVAVIGNAASAIQFIPPVAKQAAEVYVYQRSANYILPRNDREYSEKAQRRFRHHPWLRKLERLKFFLRQELLLYGAMVSGSLRQRLATRAALKYLADTIDDPEMRAALTPDYELGCKRVLVSDDYYQALARGNVSLVTSPIVRVEPWGIATEDELRREVDVIIYGTGFRATDFLAPLTVTGSGGLDLGRAWAHGARAHRGVAVHGFPNLFLLYGPNTNLGHNSIIYMVEAQVKYIVQCIEKLRAHGLRSLEPTRAAMDQYNESLQEDLAATVWGGSCGSWYKNEAGLITNNWPHTALRFARSMRHPDFSEYDMAA